MSQKRCLMVAMALVASVILNRASATDQPRPANSLLDRSSGALGKASVPIPTFSSLYNDANDCLRKGEYARARDYWLEATRHYPKNHHAYNGAAWLLATCPDPKIRDGKKALEYATKACELTDWKEPASLDTLAAAHAECGNFIKALIWQSKALAVAPKEKKEECWDRFDLYMVGKPCRTPAPADVERRFWYHSFIASNDDDDVELPQPTGDDIPQPRSVSGTTWRKVFGSHKDAPLTMYCLMGQGFFMAPTSDDTDGVVERWLKAHPEAKVTPVYAVKGVTTDEPNSMLVYVWVRDQEACLNIDLVRQGCCSADTMESPVKSMYVSKAEYERFVKQAEEAEAKARQENLGIWKKGKESKRD